MKYLVLFISITFSLAILSCGKEDNDTSLRGRIEGKWEMIKVLDRSKDVTKNHNPDGNRWIRFVKDDKVQNGGYFESGRGDQKDNTGQWSLKGFEIFIDSDAGNDDDSYWQVIIKGNDMHWIGQRFDFNKRFEIFYERAD
jgi:hypothetical protein